MKFRIRNEFSKESTNDGHWSVTPFDYDKVKDGRIVEFNTEKELFEFMRDVVYPISYVENHTWDWIESSIGANLKTGEMEIRVYARSAD